MRNNRKLTCIIIEDEPIAAEVLQDYIQEISFLELKGICKDALYALDILKKQSIDVLFLDIHLPKFKGLELLQTLHYQPQVILTTAYHQYTLDAFELGVVDYLMKPIEFSRFLKAINKLSWQDHSINNYSNTTENSVLPKRNFHFFNVNKKMIRIYFDEVLYVESLKDYSRIFTASESLVTRGQIGEMNRLFEPQGFLRIHRSYLVAIDKIKAFSAVEIEVAGKSFPIGRSYKEKVAKILAKRFEI